MSSKDDPTPEERLNALLEDAGNNRVASGEASRLPVDVAEKALDELVTSARADEKKRGRSSRHRTQDALEAIFIESGLAQAMYVKTHRVAQYIKELASPPSNTLETLMIVDIKAPADDTEALMKMTGRFARP